MGKLMVAELGRASDEALARAAGAGEHLAFGELHRRYQPIFAGYVRRRLGQDVADVVQNAFIHILKGLPQFSGPRFFPWAFRICVNTVTDELRLRSRRPQLVDTESVSVASTGGHTPEQELLARQLCNQLSLTLDQLPLEQSAVFLLARVQGLGYDEIAALLAIPLGTVKSRMFKAVKALFAKGGES